MRLYDPFIITYLALLKLLVMKFCRACGSAEYEIRGECCPMCPAGKHVYKHCVGDSSTTCMTCPQLTYTDIPNGLDKCIICSVCDEGSGLRTKEACSPNANTLCEPLPGYYCTEIYSNNCIKAKKHSTCSPGQYINHTGTTFADTVCKDCSEGTYSDGSFSFCKPHKKCKSTGQITRTWGTNSADSLCTDKRSHLLSIIAFSLQVLVILGVVVRMFCKRRIKTMESENVQSNAHKP